MSNSGNALPIILSNKISFPLYPIDLYNPSISLKSNLCFFNKYSNMTMLLFLIEIFATTINEYGILIKLNMSEFIATLSWL